MKQYSVEVAQRAACMLDEHMQFLAQASHLGATKTKKEILSAIATLSTMPERHPYLESDIMPSNCYHKFLICYRYLTIYLILDDTVYVDYILDCRQDSSWLQP